MKNEFPGQKVRPAADVFQGFGEISSTSPSRSRGPQGPKVRLTASRVGRMDRGAHDGRWTVPSRPVADRAAVPPEGAGQHSPACAPGVLRLRVYGDGLSGPGSWARRLPWIVQLLHDRVS